MDDGFVVQVTVRGIDSGGREVEFVIRGNDDADFSQRYERFRPKIEALKPLPQKTYSGKGQFAKKQYLPLPNAPKCAKHGVPLNINEVVKDGKELHFWACPERDNGDFCKAPRTPQYPTPAQVSEWKKLNGIEETQKGA